MAISPSSPPGVQREHPSKRWWRSKAIGGRSRTVSRPRRTSSDTRSANPSSYRRWRSSLLHHLVSGGNIHRNAGGGRRPSVGDRGQFRDREERVRTRSQREQILARLASSRVPGDARLRHDGGDPPSRQSGCAKKNATPNQDKNKDLTPPSLIRWSIQEVRRIATRLARKRIQPAHIIAWSLWRRAHQAAAQRAHFKCI